MRYLLAILSFAAFSSSANAFVNAIVTDAYDGDTLTIHASIWPDLTWSGSVRVRGIDTPEIRGACDAEKQAAVAVRDDVRELLIDETVWLNEVENDKWAGARAGLLHEPRYGGTGESGGPADLAEPRAGLRRRDARELVRWHHERRGRRDRQHHGRDRYRR